MLLIIKDSLQLSKYSTLEYQIIGEGVGINGKLDHSQKFNK